MVFGGKRMWKPVRPTLVRILVFVQVLAPVSRFNAERGTCLPFRDEIEVAVLDGGRDRGVEGKVRAYGGHPYWHTCWPGWQLPPAHWLPELHVCP